MSKKDVLDSDGLSQALCSRFHDLKPPRSEVLNLQLVRIDGSPIPLDEVADEVRAFCGNLGFIVSAFGYEETSSKGRMMFFGLYRDGRRYKGILEGMPGFGSSMLNILIFDASELFHIGTSVAPS